MSAYEKGKKLRSLNSLETNCTLDDNWDRSIKINVLSPRGQPVQKSPASSIRELTIEEDLPSPGRALNRKLINVPELSKKHPEISFLEASNNSEPVHSDRVRHSNRTNYKSSECLDESMDFREMNISIASRMRVTDGQFSNSGRIKNIIEQPTTRKQEKGLREQELLSSRGSHAELSRCDESKIEMIINMDEPREDFDQVKAYLDQQISRAAQRETHAKQIVPKLRLSAKYEGLQPLKSERGLKENRSSSRIKLRDYLYMVEATSRQAKTRKHQAHRSPKPESPVLSKATSESNLRANAKLIEQAADNSNNFSSRKDYVKSKYSVSNRRMFDILKEEIFAEIQKAESSLRTVRDELEEVEASVEPSNEELLILYNLRREMKEEVNRRLEATIESIRGEKRAHHLTCSRDIEDLPQRSKLFNSKN